MIPQKQLSLEDIFQDCQEIYESDKPQFLSLLESHIHLDELIPDSFYKHYYSHTGRPRRYPLSAMLWALIIQRIFSIPSDVLLLTFLHYSRHLRRFCGFDKIPDSSKITRFKQDFLDDLNVFFDRLVDVTEPICQQIDPVKASMTIYDSSGIEAYVRENNPKFANTIIRQLKAWASAKGLDPSFDPYKAAYSRMPSHAEAEPQVKQQYLNGHFGYYYMTGLFTNGLGILRAIEFYDEDYFRSHPEIGRSKKTDSPDEDKSVSDSRLLMPGLKAFFKRHPLIDPGVFLGDASFDAIEIYKELLSGDTFGTFPDGSGRHFSRAYIPLNSRASSEEGRDYTLDSNGIPCCPNDPSLPMKEEGNTSHLRCGIPTRKFVCPKMNWKKGSDGKYHRKCHCEAPCTDSKSGRMIYIYPEKDLRLYPGTIRGTDEWKDTYKTRTTVERSINHMKDCFCLEDRKTRNPKTLHADLLLSGITQLITVLLADKIHHHEYIRSLKPLIA